MADKHLEIEALLASTTGCMLATQNSEDTPEASYTPFVWHDDALFIFVSELAAHTQNLQRHPNASILMLDERHTGDAFARKRVTLCVSAAPIDRTTPYAREVLGLFKQKCGDTIELLQSLKDFHLIQLTINSGSLIEGFAKTYRFEGNRFEQAHPVTAK